MQLILAETKDFRAREKIEVKGHFAQNFTIFNFKLHTPGMRILPPRDVSVASAESFPDARSERRGKCFVSKWTRGREKEREEERFEESQNGANSEVRFREREISTAWYRV